jgi:hypothetical protein
MDLMDFLEKEGFIKGDGDFRLCNEKDIEFGNALVNWAEQECVAYDIDSEQVFDSVGLDIYCYAFAYWRDCGEVCAQLFTVYCS